MVAAMGVALFSALDAMMKAIASTYPLAQSTGMRYWAGALVAAMFYRWTSKEWPSQQALVRSIPRAIVNLMAGTSFFLAVSRLPLVDTIALTFLSPLFLAAWGRIFLHEHLHPQALLAMLVGLVGVGVVAYGQGAGQGAIQGQPLDLLGLGAAIATAALYAPFPWS
ncbi:EamA family transporter [Curvibacter sp. CHRR-16]|uniref:EamA family transporter n=1 Tax=Curvibacter sp. CHRR-16 TaxID=2835872 RepID=UPI001BD96F53|nr:EamA family transporter [Curvibacter sp. CHRR-16]MBT0571626.1 EamA family transporter [Curvibacter sp. CHRR-16]